MAPQAAPGSTPAAAPGKPPASPVFPAAPGDRRVAVPGGVELAVRLANPEGPGVPVLLVHGLSSNARTWDGVARRLAGLGHPVATLDQRGHGRSDKPDTGYDFATVTDDLAAVIAALGWTPSVTGTSPAGETLACDTGPGDRRPLVAGQSWGGNVVLELAVRHPNAIRAIACVDGGTLEVSRRFPTWEQALAALTPPRLSGLTASEFGTMIRTWHPDWSDEAGAGTLANMEVKPDGTIAPWLTLDRHLKVVRQLWEHHPPTRWPLVRVPVLLIPSQLADDDGIAQAVVGIPVGRLQIAPFPEADHDVHVQYPDEIATLLHTFASRE